MSWGIGQTQGQQPSGSQEGDAHRKVIGLVPAPEMPAEVSRRIIDRLPPLLADYVDDRLSWEVELIVDPLIGAAEDSTYIVGNLINYKQQRQWDYVICITDLPIRKRNRFVVAEASKANSVALISLPTFGATTIRRRLCEAILQLANEMHHGSSVEDRTRQSRHTSRSRKVHESLRGQGAWQLLGTHLYEKLFPIRRLTLTSEEHTIDVRFIAETWINGNLRILAGMVRANRPWTIFPAFKGVIAAAFATGTYGLVFPNLWQLSDHYGWPRLVLLMVVAMLAMIAWIILAHNLWEPPRKASSPYLARLYNAVTVLTLSAGVAFYYAILLILFCIVALVFVPFDMLETKLGHTIELLDYIVLAWLTTSVATFVGALGVGLEDEETVRNATYGYRQRHRNQRKGEGRNDLAE